MARATVLERGICIGLGTLSALFGACGGRVNSGDCEGNCPCLEATGGAAGSGASTGGFAEGAAGGAAGAGPAIIESASELGYWLEGVPAPRRVVASGGLAYVFSIPWEEPIQASLFIAPPGDGETVFALEAAPVAVTALAEGVAFATDAGVFVARPPDFSPVRVEDAAVAGPRTCLAADGDALYAGGAGVARLDLGGGDSTPIVAADALPPVSALAVDGAVLYVAADGGQDLPGLGTLYRANVTGEHLEALTWTSTVPALLSAEAGRLVWEGFTFEVGVDDLPAQLEGTDAGFDSMPALREGRLYRRCRTDLWGMPRHVCSAPWGGDVDRIYVTSAAELLDFTFDGDLLFTLEHTISGDTVTGNITAFVR